MCDQKGRCENATDEKENMKECIPLVLYFLYIYTHFACSLSNLASLNTAVRICGKHGGSYAHREALWEPGMLNTQGFFFKGGIHNLLSI